MKDYVRISLETHLFFARIMKEHSLFLQASFVQKDMEWIKRADFFRRQFEDLLRQTVQMSNRMISGYVLESGEIVTKYTMDAERKTSELSGIPINRRITAAQLELECARDCEVTREDVQIINRLNERALWLLNGLIDFKERLLKEVKECRMYTTNYPLLIDHITREARLYRDMIESMMKNQKGCYRNLQNQEEFWNCIMMEHALFIRGLLDPCEAQLIGTADDFAHDFRELLKPTQRQDCHSNDMRTADCCDCNNTRTTDIAATRACREETISEKSLAITCGLRDFKAASTEGILNCQIKSIILPLLADHVLREANHYMRILEHGYMWREG